MFSSCELHTKQYTVSYCDPKGRSLNFANRTYLLMMYYNAALCYVRLSGSETAMDIHFETEVCDLHLADSNQDS